MKNEKKGSLFDVFFIAFLLLCILNATLRLGEKSDALSQGAFEDYLVMATISSVRAETADCLETGESLYTDAGEEYGVLEVLSSSPARLQMEQNGTVYEGVWEDTRIDLTVQIRIKGMEQGGRVFRESREQLCAGQSVTLYTKRTKLFLQILDFVPARS